MDDDAYEGFGAAQGNRTTTTGSPTDPPARRLRIGLIAPPWVPVPPTTYGGTEGLIDTLARGLDAAGHDVVLFTTGDSTCPVTRLSVFERPAEPMGSTTAECRHAQAAYDALKDCDVIHDHTTVGPVWAAARGLTTPVITTCHGEFTPENLALYREIATWASVTAISRHQRWLAPTVPMAAVIHHGVDPALFTVGAGQGGYAMFLGRLAPEKGAHEAIKIARAAGIPLRIAAKMREPDEIRYFHEQIEPELGPGVEYLGEISPAQRDHELGEALALLNPIRWAEPFGLVMIEALACGTPVITYPSGAAPEIIQHGVTGFVCTNIAEATEALGKAALIDRTMCREAVEGYFSSRRMVAEYVALYERIALGGTTVDLTQERAEQQVSLREEAHSLLMELGPA